MSTMSDNSGILEICHIGRWFKAPQPDSAGVNEDDQLTDLIVDLTRIAEIESAIHGLCIRHLAHCGITSWDGGDCAINFWCNGIDATLRWNVGVNPFDRRDPPLCLISVDIGEEGRRVLYGGVIADLRGPGPLLLSQAVVSMISEALRYEAA